MDPDPDPQEAKNIRIRIRIRNTALKTHVESCVCTGPEPGIERRDRERIRAARDKSRGCRHPRTDLQGCQATLLLSLLFFPHTTLFFRPFFFLSRRTGINIC
jgi:hypothetical protein